MNFAASPIRRIVASLILMTLMACAHNAPPSDRAYPVDHPRDCALVSGGTGSAFSDERVDKTWLEVNRKVSEYIATDMRQNGYAVQEVFTDIADRPAEPKKSLVALSRTRCALMIQVTHDVGENAQGPYFGFDIVVMHFAPNGEHAQDGTPVRTVGDFQKSWRYPRTAQELDKFHTGDFANTVFAELVASHAIDKVYGPDPDSPVVHDEYDRVRREFDQPEIHTRHILVADQARATSAIARIKAGESFAAVAKEMSIDVGSAQVGGDLGWAKANSYVPEFSRAAVALSPKGLTPEPVRSQFGWHVIELLETRPARFPPFDEVKVRVAARMKAAHDSKLSGAH